MLTLNLSFRTDAGKTMVVRIPDPVQGLTTQQIETAGAAIASSGVLLSPKLGRPIELVDAQYVERNATDMIP